MLRSDQAMPARRAAEALAAIGTPAAVDALIEPLGHDQTETAATCSTYRPVSDGAAGD